MLERLRRSVPHGFRVTPTGGSVSAARQRVISVVSGWQLGLSQDRLDDLRLLTSEVVTNALKHTGGACAVCVRWTGTRVRVEVTDHDPALPQPANGRLDEESGKGLTLVAMLAVAWGAKSNVAGKTVWFEIEADQPVVAGDRQPAGGAHPASSRTHFRPLLRGAA
ncbi:ATP-binding protein [Streptomyces johnsoniae]|uniref:ATP-binding protein n=1 Tax=Streptomyces johnsoniae TaxID=3075532 RepID=A0ABU2S7T9_9ACTN|nr:ATP-binding protein [Streptomyces sp. DSM 41886]MDT0443909.1 ATP-binding protein [Streptomyces sp. DSM 41886]